MSEWKPLNGIVEVAEAVAAGMEIEVTDNNEKWEMWNARIWNYGRLYRARPRKPSFEREARYTVFKNRDIEDYLSKDEKAYLVQIAGRITRARDFDGRPPLSCLVIERDWPEFEPTWKAIEDRAAGENRKPAKVMVKSLCWRDKDDGALLWVDEGGSVNSDCWQRFPVGDFTGEVET